MLKTADRTRLFKEVNVGAWKLEDKAKRRVRFEAEAELGVQIKRLIGLMPNLGTIKGCVWDMAMNDPLTSRNVLFSLVTDRYNKAGDVDNYSGIDLRVRQGVKVAGEPMHVDSIFFSDNFRDGMKFVGGRKIRHWGADAIPGLSTASVVPVGIPQFDNVNDLLPEVEKLCPITSVGMAEVLCKSFVSLAPAVH